MSILKKFLQPVIVALAALLVGYVFLFAWSPDDFKGALADSFLKLQAFTFRVFIFSLGLRFWFPFLDFRGTFDSAHHSDAHSRKAIAVSLVIVAWSIVVFAF